MSTLASLQRSGQGSPKPKLSSTQASALADRLCTQSLLQQQKNRDKLMAQRDLSNSSFNKTATRKFKDADEMETCTNRIYATSMDRKKKEQAKVDAKYLQNIQKNENKLDSATMEESVQKLYYQTMERKAISDERLQEKYMPERSDRTLDEDELQESLQRLYRDHDSRKREQRQKLLQKYAPRDLPPSSKLDTEGVARMGARLCKVVPRSTEEAVPWSPCISRETRDRLEKEYLDVLPRPHRLPPDQLSQAFDRLHTSGAK